jgi:hypothetical protein
MQNSSVSSVSPQEELAYIRRIIDDSRMAFVEDGKPYIAWGIIVALGMIFSYVSALMERDLGTGYVWIALTIIGWIYVFLYARKKEKASRAKSIIDRVQDATWGVVGSMIGLVIALIFIGQALNIPDMPGIHPIYICFITAVLVGIGYYLSGTVTEVRWLRNIAYAWWAGSVVMYLWPSVHVLALYAVMIIAFQVVPGIILYRKYRALTAQNAVQPAQA